MTYQSLVYQSGDKVEVQIAPGSWVPAVVMHVGVKGVLVSVQTRKGGRAKVRPENVRRRD